MERIKDIDPDDLSPSDQELMQRMVQENAPSDMEVRLGLLGVSPLTAVGFAVAFALLAVNNVMGAGWAGDMMGWNPIEVVPDSAFERQRNSQMEQMQGGAVINYEDIRQRLDASREAEGR
jgi:hypothetical protein